MCKTCSWAPVQLAMVTLPALPWPSASCAALLRALSSCYPCVPALLAPAAPLPMLFSVCNGLPPAVYLALLQPPSQSGHPV